MFLGSNKTKIVVPFVFAIGAYLVYYFLHRNVEYSPMLQTGSGKVRGILSKSRLGTEYYAFLSIPYAKPADGERRFSSPQPVEPWPGVFEATKFGPMCPHVQSLTRKIVGSEACLFLNIYTPKNAISSKKPLPVIFHIHGGYFMAGSSVFVGPKYFMDEGNVVLVTVNYRLNIFGFLNTLDSAAKGNFGLKDQNLALKWVHRNIKSFGGDPSKITLAGQSAGSVAVHLHTLSPMSKGLFSGAIMSSGFSIKPWSLVPNPKAQAEHLANGVNCPQEPTKDLVACLRNMSIYDIINSQRDALSTPVMNPLEIFAPSVENCDIDDDGDCFLPQHPWDLMRSGKAARVPILTGVNSEEGLLGTARMFFNSTLNEFVSRNWNKLSPGFFYYNDSRTDITKKIRQFYVGDDPEDSQPLPLLDKFKNVTDAFSDRLYLHATRESVKIQSQFSKVYLYYFTYPLYRGLTYMYDISPDWSVYLQFVLKEILWFLDEYILGKGHVFLGSGHGDDICLMFDLPVIHLSSPQAKDFTMSRQMIKMWIDFATNPDSMTFAGKRWDPVPTNAKASVTELQYMMISGTEMDGSMVDEPFARRMKFWDEIGLPYKL